MWGERWGDMVWGGVGALERVPAMGVWGLVILAGVLVAVAYSRRLPAGLIAGLILGIAVSVSLGAVARGLEVPYTFFEGTVAIADEVNENFAAIVETVAGTAPSITIPVIGNFSPAVGGGFNFDCSYRVSDADGDIVQVRQVLYIDQGQMAETLLVATAFGPAPGGFSGQVAGSGSAIRCEATPSDGKSFGSTAISAVTILP